MSHASRTYTHLNIRMKQGITETEKGLAEISTAHHTSTFINGVSFSLRKTADKGPAD